jgi:hypothetical protein
VSKRAFEFPILDEADSLAGEVNWVAPIAHC